MLKKFFEKHTIIEAGPEDAGMHIVSEVPQMPEPVSGMNAVNHGSVAAGGQHVGSKSGHGLEWADPSASDGGLSSPEDTINALQSKIEALEAEVQALMWDDTFGMFNSAGLMRRLSLLVPGQNFGLAFLDLNCLHHLNNLFGYEEVNRKIRATFGGKRPPETIIGRVFSGDEILVASPGGVEPLKGILRNIAARGSENKISFVSAVCTWKTGTAVDPVLGELGCKLLDRKKNHLRVARDIQMDMQAAG